MSLYSYLWAFSTITKAALQANSAYNIENFPVQADQTSPVLGWHEPQRKGTERPRPARIAQAADLTVRADGYYEFTWSLPPMTPGAFTYLLTNQWPGGVWSANATVQTWDDAVNGYSAFNCIAIRPVPGSDFDILDTFYVDVKYKFVGGVLL